jgi:hypothetical protein
MQETILVEQGRKDTRFSISQNYNGDDWLSPATTHPIYSLGLLSQVML